MLPAEAANEYGCRPRQQTNPLPAAALKNPLPLGAEKAMESER
jgi:hypothetical protein